MSSQAPATFDGIVREDGRTGTRNYIGVLVTVNCAATVARKIAEHFDAERLAAFPNVDGVISLTHELGCGMEMTGEPMDLLRRTIAGTIRNPNLGAAVLVGLGCERNNLAGLLEQEKLAAGPRLETLVMQEKGGTAATVALGIAAVERMLPVVNRAKRSRVDASHMRLGVQAAAADSLAGLGAHPALGVAIDLVVRHGGTVIVSGSVAGSLEGAQAAARRWSGAPLAAAYRYAQPVTARGLVFMDSPAYEAISATGQVAGGANVVCMTTARGSGFGTAPAPTIKIATSTEAYRRMQDDIDINAGEVVDGTATADEMGRRIFEAILRVASGERTRAEELGVGESEFVPWPIGVFS